MRENSPKRCVSNLVRPTPLTYFEILVYPQWLTSLFFFIFRLLSFSYKLTPFKTVVYLFVCLFVFFLFRDHSLRLVISLSGLRKPSRKTRLRVSRTIPASLFRSKKVHIDRSFGFSLLHIWNNFQLFAYDPKLFKLAYNLQLAVVRL